MTISSEDSKTGPYDGNDATVVFAYDFQIDDEAWILVTLTDSSGVDTVQTITTDYTVSGVEAPGGGNVTMGVPPATGEEITFTRDVTKTQLLDLANQGGWFPELIEAAFDKLTMIVQEFTETLSRSLKVSVSDDSGADFTIPALEANKFLRAASDGLSFVWSTLASLGAVVISDILPLVAGTVDAGTSDEISRVDHVHPSAKDVEEALTNKTLNDHTNFIHADAVHIKSRNVSGGPFSRGQVVYESAYNSGQDAIEILLADADDAGKMPALGIVDEGILNNANGHVIKVGVITGDATDNLNTTGGGEAWSVGNDLYVDTTAGALTNVRPTGRATGVQAIAVVLRVHASLGSIFVDGAGRINALPNQILLPEGAAVSTGAGEGAIYTKDIGGQPELFFREESDGDEIQLTSGGGATGGLTHSQSALTALTGTALDLTGIPADAVQIDINIDNGSTNGTSNWLIQLLVGGSPETSGYNAISALGSGETAYTTGFGIAVVSASVIASGKLTLTRADSSSNLWTLAGGVGAEATTAGFWSYGAKSLAGTLDGIRFRTVNGTDTWDNGNASWTAIGG